MYESLSGMWIVLFVALVVGVVLGNAFSKRYFSLLRSDFPDVWAGMQSGNVFFGELKTQVNLLKFIFTKSYAEVGGEEQVRQGSRLRSTFLIYFSFLAIFLVLSVFLSLSRLG